MNEILFEMFRESTFKEVTFVQRDQNKSKGMSHVFLAEGTVKSKALQWACAQLAEERQGGE